MSHQNPMFVHGNFSWQEHHGAQSSVSGNFYRDVLGWELEEIAHAGGQTYTTVKVAGLPTGGFIENEDTTASWLPYITVDDVDRRVKAAREAGANIISEPNSVPGVGRMATLIDPQGARIAFITYESMMEGTTNA